MQDLTSNCIFTRILQDPCKERIFSRPGYASNMFFKNSTQKKKLEFLILREFYKGKSWNVFEIDSETGKIWNWYNLLVAAIRIANKILHRH